VLRGLAAKQSNKTLIKGRQFTAEITLWAVRWYLQLPISYRDLKHMFSDRGIQVNTTTLSQGIQASAPDLDKRIRPHLRMTNGSWQGDETYIRLKGEGVYLYRAVDAKGQTIDFLLSPKRDAAAARCYFKVLGKPHPIHLRTIAGDEAMAMIRKGQVIDAPTNGMVAQRDFIAILFGAAA